MRKKIMRGRIHNILPSDMRVPTCVGQNQVSCSLFQFKPCIHAEIMESLAGPQFDIEMPGTPAQFQATRSTGEAWEIYLARPEAAIRMSTAVIAASGDAISTERGWALLTRALAQCRSMEVPPVADRIRADFSAAESSRRKSDRDMRPR